MNPTLLRKVLMWVAPIAIGYVLKKYEAKRAKKTQDKALARNAHA